ncbi:3189_t:CDS:2 [Gigaspora margarita]|uniref:3189_t:CDS:1 n=1 Tax=Gigaspora margarita TaxID=4874 RepID=A0ABM8W4Y6_GIGMA|nr:3189_t:CDS:2 [Gigaspora margarita]
MNTLVIFEDYSLNELNNAPTTQVEDIEYNEDSENNMPTTQAENIEQNRNSKNRDDYTVYKRSTTDEISNNGYKVEIDQSSDQLEESENESEEYIEESLKNIKNLNKVDIKG